MGFYINSPINELKQHINLSEEAWSILKLDIMTFYTEKGKESFSGFFNRIFINFYQDASASITYRINEKIEELKDLYKSEDFESIDKNTIKFLIDTQIKVYKKELLNKAQSYSKGSGEKIRLNKKSCEILSELDFNEDYDDNIGLYLKAIFEEYSRKPMCEREMIFFYDIYFEAMKAIEKKKKLKVTLLPNVNNESAKFYLSPYKIVQDEARLFNYIIGYSEKIISKSNAPEHELTDESKSKKADCFRLSRIMKIDMQKSMNAHITREQEKECNKNLIDRTAMYMTGDIFDIKVKFTDKGLELFKRLIYMRPHLFEKYKENPNIYTFCCSKVQAMNYFFKFGQDAIILEPIDLQNVFKEKYKQAFSKYEEK